MSTAKMFALASLIMALGTVVLGLQTSLAEPAADECKTTPGSSAPSGQHWYYRVNRSDQRHCWYLGAEATKVRAQTREGASSSPPRTAREEASETTPTMPPPMEVVNAVGPGGVQRTTWGGGRRCSARARSPASP